MYPSTDTLLPQNDVFAKKTQTLDTPDETHKGEEQQEDEEETREIKGNRGSKMKVRRMNKLALKKEMNWRERVKFLTDRILSLKCDEFVGDVLEEHRVLFTPTDFCFVVKSVGQSSWQRALELYECLNMQQWYAPNARMIATILGVLGKANQEGIAVEIFTKAESVIEDTVQVYNAMMGVYARNGNFEKVNEMFNLMRERGCEPDIVSFNTLINAKVKSCAMVSGLAIELLDEVGKFGLRPDIITYNTLISACSRESNLKEAIGVFSHMESNRCQPDLWTYNAMISVYGRCGFALKAEHLFEKLKSNGFSPDAVTYNSLLYAFSKEGNTEKVTRLETWVMSKYGEKESWRKAFSIEIKSYCGLSPQDKHRPIGFNTSGEMWVTADSDSRSFTKCLVSFNPETGVFRNIEIGGAASNIQATPQVLSYVSIKKMVNIRHSKLQLQTLRSAKNHALGFDLLLMGNFR